MTSTPSMTVNDVRDYLLRQPVSEEVLPYGDGRGNLRRLTLTFDFSRDDLPPWSYTSTSTPARRACCTSPSTCRASTAATPWR